MGSAATRSGDADVHGHGAGDHQLGNTDGYRLQAVSGAAFPVTLNPSQSATLSVQFDPTATGAAAGQLTYPERFGGRQTQRWSI